MGSWSEYSYCDYLVSWLDLVDHVLLKVNVDASAKHSSWNILSAFLDANNLEVVKVRKTVLEAQNISFSVIDWNLVGLDIFLGLELSELQIVKIALNLKLACFLAEMNALLYPRLRLRAVVDISFEKNKLVNQRGFQASRSDGV